MGQVNGQACQHMLLFQEPTCHMNDMPFLYDMTTSFLYPYAFFNVSTCYYMNDLTLPYDMKPLSPLCT